MSDMSTGQIVGGIAGGVIGFFAGGPMGAVQGFAIGAGIGGYIDPPPGPNLKGPTLDDKSFQSSAYGVSIPRLYGTIAPMGNIIYLENNEYKAITKKESQGGKGGGGATVTATTYLATFAVALGLARPDSSVRRIWAGGKLIYSKGTVDLETIVQSYLNTGSGAARFKFYDGSQVDPDGRMESVLGIGNVPSYEGTCYIIFYDFDLTDYGNGLAGCPIKVEISDSSNSEWEVIEYRSIPFSDPEYYTDIKCLRPLDSSGASHGFTYSFTQKIALTRTVNTDESLFTSLTPYPDERDFVSVVDGYSERSRYCLLQEYYEDGIKLRRVYVTSSSNYLNDYVSDADVYQAGAARIYELSDGVFFLMKATNISTDFTPGAWFIGVPNSRDMLIDFLNATSDCGPVAIGGGFIINIAPSVSTTHLVSAWSYSGDFVKSFYVVLNRDFDGIGFSRPALVSDGLAIFLISNPGDLAAGDLVFAIIDIISETIVLNTISGHAPGAVKSDGFPAINLVGSVLAVSTVLVDDTVFIWYLSIGSLVGFSSKKLSEICEEWFNISGVTNYDFTEIESDYVSGYRVDGQSSARGALSQLQAAYLFDFVEDGYLIRAIKRGSPPVALIHYENIIQKSDASIKKDLIVDSQLPSRYLVKYSSVNREYETDVEAADYPSLYVNERSEQFAIVMSANQAAKCADILMSLSWIERASYSFSLPQSYIGLKPGSVIDIESESGRIIRNRIDSISYAADGTVDIHGKSVKNEVYQSGALGSEPDSPVETLPLAGDSVAFLLDIPMVINSLDSPGFVAAMTGFGSWHGGALVRSSDSGQTYSEVASFFNRGTIGQALNSLLVNSGLIADTSSELRITVIAGMFFSITHEQMMMGNNFCAYGADGRWEICRYANAALQSNGDLILTDFVRGLRGTEWATGLHQVGDYIVLLDDPDNQFIGADLNSIGFSRLFKGVSIGQNYIDAQSQSFAYNGINLKPLSPVNVSGFIATNIWVINFMPRTRYAANPWKTGVMPITESVIEYQVDIYKAGSVVRTLTSSVLPIYYEAADQLADFGSYQSTIDVKIYQISQRVGRGYPLSATL